MNIYTWHKVGAINALFPEENKPTEVLVAEKRVCLLRRNNTVYAFAALCPHAGTPLSTGWIDALGRIVCPNHMYRFDPANGRNTSGEGYKLFTYPVEIREDEVFIGFLT